jgi:hypothetical protein
MPEFEGASFWLYLMKSLSLTFSVCVSKKPMNKGYFVAGK